MEGERRTGPALTQITDQLYLETDAVLSPRSRIWPGKAARHNRLSATGSAVSAVVRGCRSPLSARAHRYTRRCASTYPPHHVVTLRALAFAHARMPARTTSRYSYAHAISAPDDDNEQLGPYLVRAPSRDRGEASGGICESNGSRLFLEGFIRDASLRFLGLFILGAIETSRGGIPFEPGAMGDGDCRSSMRASFYVISLKEGAQTLFIIYIYINMYV